MTGDFDQAKHSPDSSFARIDKKSPHLIIETSFSQKRKDLPRLADDYILGSHGNVKLVLGLDIEYRNTKTATVSVWEYEEGIEEDGVRYISVKKIVDEKVIYYILTFPKYYDLKTNLFSSLGFPERRRLIFCGRGCFIDPLIYFCP